MYDLNIIMKKIYFLLIILLNTAIAYGQSPQALMNSGKYGKAYEAAIKMDDLRAASAAAYAYHCYIDSRNMQWVDKLQKTSRKALATYPNNPKSYLHLSAAIYAQSRDSGRSVKGFNLAKESLSVLEDGVKRFPKNVSLLMGLARWHSSVYARQGRLGSADPMRARHLVFKVLRLAPDSARVAVEIGLTMADLKDHRAEKYLNRGLKIAPTNALERELHAQGQTVLKNLQNVRSDK